MQEAQDLAAGARFGACGPQRAVPVGVLQHHHSAAVFEGCRGAGEQFNSRLYVLLPVFWHHVTFLSGVCMTPPALPFLLSLERTK